MRVYLRSLAIFSFVFAANTLLCQDNVKHYSARSTDSISYLEIRSGLKSKFKKSQESIPLISTQSKKDNRKEYKNAWKSKLDSAKLIYRQKWWNDVKQVTGITVYGGGSLYNNATNNPDSTKSSTTPSGSLGINFVTQKLSTNVYFSYNDKSIVEMSTLNNFSSSLMNPIRSGQSFSASVNLNVLDGLSIYSNFLIADNLWRVQDTMSNTMLIDSSPFFLKFGLLWEPLDTRGVSVAENDISLVIFPYYSHRSIAGDFSNSIRTIEGNAIKPRGYNGFGVKTSIVLGTLELFVEYTNNSLIQNLELLGFEGGQVNFGLNVTGSALNYPLQKKAID